MRIRPAAAGDADRITALHATGWRAGYGELFPLAVVEDAIRARRSRWVDLLDSGLPEGMHLLVAEEKTNLAGFCHFGSHHEHAGAGMVHSFYVHPSRWGSGVASSLMVTALDRARDAGYRSVFLTAYERSARARAFYEKMGFRETGRTFETELPGYGPTTDIEYVLDLHP